MHRRLVVTIAAVLSILVALAVFVLVYFQPQKLFIDNHVSEAFPAAAAPTPAPPTTVAAVAPPAPTAAPPGRQPPAATTTAPPAPSQPVAERAGTFVSREHATSGTATLYRVDAGRLVLRIEDLDTSNGPALFVYLSTNPADGPNSAFDDIYADLGALKGNIGDQNYELPPDVDASAFTSVVIWCDRFNVAFGAANLG